MLEVFITRGLPASGKSTYAKNLATQKSFKRINKDDLRMMLDNSVYSKTNEKFIIEVRNSLILSSLNNGFNVIVDDTNLNNIHIEQIEELVKGKAIVKIIDFTDIPLEVCIERDKERVNSVGEKVILDMYNKFLKNIF